MASTTASNPAPVSDLVNEAATKEIAEVLQRHNTTPTGLTETEAAARLEKFGPNQVAEEKHHGWLQRLYLAVRNPLVILLSVLAIITFATAGGASDIAGGVLMVLMVVLAFHCDSSRRRRPTTRRPNSRR
jgi:Mg2+-importing ATPase